MFVSCVCVCVLCVLVCAQGPAYPPNTLIWGEDMAATLVGEDTSFFIQSYDRYGNKRSSGHDPLTVLLTLRPQTRSEEYIYINGSITNHGFANYTATYQVTVSAQYMLDVKVYGSHVGAARNVRSPLRLFAAADSLDPAMTTVSGSFMCTLSKVSQFVLSPRDRFGNFLGNGGSKVDMSLCTPSSCLTRPGQAAIEVTFYNRNTKSYLTVQKRFVSIVKLDTNPNAVSVDILPRSDGAFGIFFTVRAEGNYSVSVLVDQKHIRGSPLTLMAYKEDLTPSAPMSVFTLDELVEWPAHQRQAGMKFTGTLVTRNRFGVDLSLADANLARASLLQDVSHDLSLRSNLDGTFALSLQITKAGQYSLTVYTRATPESDFNSQVQASPFVVTVDASLPSAVTTMALISNVGQYEAGFELSFLVQTRDRFGNEQTAQSYPRFTPARLSPKMILNGASVKTVWGLFADQKNGQYAIQFPAVTKAGKYVLVVTDSGFGVGRTPMSIVIQPAALSPQHSQLLVSDPRTSIFAGTEVLVQVSPRDKYGNARTMPDDASRDAVAIRVELLSPVDNSTTSVGTADPALIPWRAVHASSSGLDGEVPGRLYIFVGGAKVGRYLVHVEMEIGDARISVMNSPLVHEVRPSIAVGAMSRISTTVPATSLAGDLIHFGLQPTDAFENHHQRPLGETFLIQVKGFSYLNTCGSSALAEVPGQDCVEMVGRPDNAGTSTSLPPVYSANFFLTLSGRYTIDVALVSLRTAQLEVVPGGGAVQPFTLEILPGPIETSQFVLRGSGARQFVSGTRTYFQVQACDRFANYLSQGGDSVIANITHVPIGSNVTAARFASSRQLSVVDKMNDGSYDVSYLLTIAGHYSILVSVQDVHQGVLASVTGHAAQAASSATSGVTLTAEGLPYAESISVGTAGIQGTFKLHARDEFWNTLSVGGDVFTLEVAGPTLGETAVLDRADGSYYASYKVQQKGRYKVSVRLNGIHVGVLFQSLGSTAIQPSPFGNLDIYENAPPFAAVSLAGSGLSTAIAGMQALFTIVSRDGLSTYTCCTGSKATGWDTEVQKLTDGKEDYCDSCWTRGEIAPSRAQQDQVAQVSFRADLHGKWLLSVFSRVNSFPMHVTGSPFLIDVMPADVDATKSIVTGAGLKGVLLRKQGKVQVLTKDLFANARTHPLLPFDDVQVMLQGTEPKYLDREDSGPFAGKYLGSFCGCVGCEQQSMGLTVPYTACAQLPSLGGCAFGCQDCRCFSNCICTKGSTTLNVMVKMQHVLGSPFVVTVYENSATTSASESAVITDMSVHVTAGSTVQVLVQVRDVRGVDKASGGDTLAARTLRDTSAVFQVSDGILPFTDNEDGTYTLEFVPTIATAHALEIKVNSVLIGGSRTGDQAVTGTNKKLILNAAANSVSDAYLNFAVLIDSGTGAGQIARITSYDAHTATATFAVAPDATSVYTLIPSILVVLPGSVSPQRTTVFCGFIENNRDSGSKMLPVPSISKGSPLVDGASCGISQGMASDKSQFFVQLRDEYGNSLTTGQSQELSVRVVALLDGNMIPAVILHSFCSDSSLVHRQQCMCMIHIMPV